MSPAAVNEAAAASDMTMTIEGPPGENLELHAATGIIGLPERRASITMPI
jgi:hypothetical protein